MSQKCAQEANGNHTGDKSEHVRNGAAHPKRKMKLSDGEQCKEQRRQPAESTLNGAAESAKSESIVAGETQAYCTGGQKTRALVSMGH
jgi:hypothetical protein